ncbi:MAG: substrate-binding domain-containing protein [Verrucomicrobiota bacterium]
MKAISLAASLLLTVTAFGEMPVPATVDFMFDGAASQGVKTVATGDAQYLKSIQRSGGTITNGWWFVTAGTAFGQGNLQFTVDRSLLNGDLALVLRTDWQRDTNIAIQLLDAEGRAIALDLFGETRHNARAIGTDTFVIPLNRYPDAVTVSVRRLSGDLRILGGGLYPVLSEVTAAAETEKALAERLGLMLSPHHWMFAQGGKETPAVAESGVGAVHTLPPLSKTNEAGAAALRQPGYPIYNPLTQGELAPPKIITANTASYIVTNALRTIALRTSAKPAEPFFSSSDGTASGLLKHGYQVGFMSVPLTSAEKETFFRERGYSITEIRFARDALEILVNSANPIGSLTVPQLDAVFGKDLRAGAPALIRSWDQLGNNSGTIKTVGGSLGWGTTRAFQQLVLKGGAFRNDMAKEDVVFTEGVEQHVADNTDAIGFASFRPRTRSVRTVAIAANSGEAAFLPNAETIYSDKYPLQRNFYAYVASRSLASAGAFERELFNLILSDVGQTLVARSGNLPLTAREAAAERTKLGLP